MTLIYISGAWLLGIFLGSQFSLPVAMVLTGLVPLGWLFFRRRHRRAVVLATVSLVALLGGILYYPLRLPSLDETSLPSYHQHREVTVKGIISAQPEPGANSIRLRFTAREVREGTQ